MRPDDLLELLNGRPFKPFQLHLTNGRIYEVRHPELVIVGRSIAWVRVRVSNYPFIATQETVVIVLIHIVLVEFPDSSGDPAMN